MFKWGLVIQGPARSVGDSRFKYRDFDCNSSVLSNLKNARGLFDDIVLSTWEGERWEIPASELKQLYSMPPTFDRANSRKQFISTLKGLEHLEEANVDFVVKIRTDQVISRKAFEEIRGRFESNLLQSALLLSDFVPGTLFYLGDFVIAGSFRSVQSWVNSILGFGPIALHPLNAVDFVVKYLSVNDPEFAAYMNPYVPAALQAADPRNNALVERWENIRQENFRFLSRESFESLVWRGQRITDVIETTGLGFDEDNLRAIATSLSGIGALGALGLFARRLYEFRKVLISAQGTTPLRETARGLVSGRYLT